MSKTAIWTIAGWLLWWAAMVVGLLLILRWADGRKWSPSRRPGQVVDVKDDGVDITWLWWDSRKA